jgi:hypothetical protein
MEEQQELYDNLIARLEHIKTNCQEQLDKVVSTTLEERTSVIQRLREIDDDHLEL